jgi:7-cyano-7-deazaguanine synthase in queuosine biosynthesis
MRQKKVVLMNSGGPDCACVAKKLINDGYYVVSVYVDSGQLNRKVAMEAAEETADRWAHEHHIVTIDFGIPPNYINAKTNELHAMPALNSFMIVTGTIYASTWGYPEVFFGLAGVIDDDWIERERDWIEGDALAANRPDRYYPILNMSKREAVSWAGLSPKDLSYTVSCNYPKPCKTCWKCRARKEAYID